MSVALAALPLHFPESLRLSGEPLVYLRGYVSASPRRSLAEKN